METKLKDLLSEKRAAILERWFDVILETYPADTANFLRGQKNRFANPVGATISTGIENIFDELLNGTSPDKPSSFLDNLIRIRAVQDFTPSQAVSFIFLLKQVIREKLKEEKGDNIISEELLALESKIDSMALSSFDIYMKCREKLYEIKTNEVNRMTFRLLQQANLICEIPEQQNSVESNNLNIKRKEVKQ